MNEKEFVQDLKSVLIALVNVEKVDGSPEYVAGYEQALLDLDEWLTVEFLS